MAGIMDSIGKAVSKAVEGAKDLYEKAKPGIDDALEKVSGEAKELYEKARPGVEEALGKVAEGAKNLADKAKEAVQNAAETGEKADAAAKDALDDIPEAPKAPETEKPRNVLEQIDQEVKDQVQKMRDAATKADPIHEYFQKTYNKKAEPADTESQPEKPSGLEGLAEMAKEAAAKAHSAAEQMGKALSEGVQNLGAKVQEAFDNAKGVEAAQDVTDAVKDDLAKAEAEAKAAVEEAAETVEDAVDEATEAVEEAKEAAAPIFEGPTAETLSEIFETKASEETPSRPHED